MALFVSFPFRLIIDYDFLKWILTKAPNKHRIISGLLRINVYSKENRKKNNLILKEDLDKILAESLTKDKDLILAGVKGYTFATEIQDEITSKKFDDVTRRVILGIVLTEEYPYDVAILTTKENSQKYLTNSFFNQIKGLTIKTEEEGAYLIENLFKIFCSQKENSNY